MSASLLWKNGRVADSGRQFVIGTGSAAGLVLGDFHGARVPMLEISVHELKRAMDGGEDLLLLDVRNAEELAVASIAGARHIPMGEIVARVGELEDWRDRRIAVMCHAGVRSARVQAFLVGEGFSRVENVAGGIHAWSLEVDPSVAVY